MKRPPQIPISDSDWQRTPTAVQVLVVSSSERVGQLEQVVEQQAARVASLEEELARRKGRSRRGARAASSQSGASSSPRTDASRRRSSGRSPGGQPGHEGHGRSWVSVEQVDELIPVKPSNCHGCGHRLTGDDPHPQRHQEVVLPPLRAEVIEYQVHTLRCAHCDRLTAAGWPEGVSRHTFGPSVQAWVSLLAGAYRLSKRNIRALLSDAFGLKVSLGTVSRLEQEVAAALAGAVEEARAFVRRQGIVNVDETGWRQGRAKAWLWTAVTDGVTVFSIRPSRGRDGVDEMLGADNRAVVGSDRYSAYAHLPLGRRQVCWAHLRRAFEEFVARGGEAERVGHHLLDRSEQLFTWWHQVRDGTLSRARFQDHIDDLCLRFRFHLCYGQRFADAKTAATCANLLDLGPALWTFARRPGVEPTNNEAERALRHGVLWRHTSFGTHSAEGSRFVERLLTVRDTLRQQQRNVLDYLRMACDAAVSKQPAPSLLPSTRSPIR